MRLSIAYLGRREVLPPAHVQGLNPAISMNNGDRSGAFFGRNDLTDVADSRSPERMRDFFSARCGEEQLIVVPAMQGKNIPARIFFQPFSNPAFQRPLA